MSMTLVFGNFPSSILLLHIHSYRIKMHVYSKKISLEAPMLHLIAHTKVLLPKKIFVGSKGLMYVDIDQTLVFCLYT